MSSFNSQIPEALEHYNRASRLRRQDDFDGAVAELDSCLCASPIPPLEMLAWFNLGEVIFLNFDFGNRPSNTVPDEEYYWSLRAAEAIRKSIEVYEKTLSKPIWENDNIAIRCHEPYQRARMLSQFFSSYGPYVKNRDGEFKFRPHVVFYNVKLQPLRCLTEYEDRMRTVARQEFGKQR
ncbi:MAG: hypothetical protein ACLGJB_02735 [Blastocatellia bacterium]